MKKIASKYISDSFKLHHNKMILVHLCKSKNRRKSSLTQKRFDSFHSHFIVLLSFFLNNYDYFANRSDCPAHVMASERAFEKDYFHDAQLKLN